MAYKHSKEVCGKFLNAIAKFKRMIERSSNLSAEDGPATMLQFQALRCIKEEPLLTTGELASNLNISLSSVAQLVDRLYKSDWIVRESDKNDRRISRLRLSKEGEQALVKIQEVIFARIMKLLSYIPAKDIEEVVRICEDAVQKYEKTKSNSNGT